ncbi:DUF4349 domain-containing protein [Microbacterium sp. MM2322]|uniref:DUF4349 domain-containing protein n=1 Tax=Microbacterium sp. MM2322 TaxID=3157631 RepID=UPI0032D58BFD
MSTEEIQLPELTRTRQDEIERTLFAEIETTTRETRESSRRHRRRVWAYTAAAAAVVVVAGFVGPALGNLTGGASSGSTASEQSVALPDEDGSEMSAGGTADLGDNGTTSAEAPERAVVARAETRLEAEDPAAAAQTIGDRAEASGGYVESMNVADAAESTGMAGATGPGDARITVRVPASGLASFLDDLNDLGTVQASDISREDVTAQTTDLDARIAALDASVDRLRGLISDAASTADLLTAEDALAGRQAELDSLRAQADALKDDVALSSATITITAPGADVAADPQGFGDGFSTGWNTLVVTLNGIVVGLGFLLPWLVLAGIVVAIVQVVRRARRRRRSRRDLRPADD